MKKLIVFAIALILVCLMGVSCDSKKSSSSNICPICHESMEGKQTVTATLPDGSKVKVCANCYAIGRQAGYVL